MTNALSKIYSEDFYLVMDKKYFPYGNKNPLILKERLNILIKHLIDKGCNKILVACNTLCSVALDDVKKNFDLEIINIIDPVIEYIKKLNVTEISLIATSNTINSGYYQNALNKINVKCNAIYGDKYILDIEEKNDFSFNEKLDKYLILGCTHFINFKHKFKAITISQDELIRFKQKVIIEET